MNRKFFLSFLSISALLCALVFAIAVIAVAPWKRATPEEIRALERAYIDLATLAGKFTIPKHPAGSTCPKDADSTVRPLFLIHDADLARFSSPQSNRWDDDEWEWVMSGKIRNFRSTARGLGRWEAQNYLKDIEAIRARDRLVVFRESSYMPPEALDRYGNFVPGSIEGWLVVMEISSGRELCRARLVAKNRDRVNYIKKNVWLTSSRKASLDRALRRDLQKSFRKNAREALARISGEFTIDF